MDQIGFLIYAYSNGFKPFIRNKVAEVFLNSLSDKDKGKWLEICTLTYKSISPKQGNPIYTVSRIYKDKKSFYFFTMYEYVLDANNRPAYVSYVVFFENLLIKEGGVVDLIKHLKDVFSEAIVDNKVNEENIIKLGLEDKSKIRFNRDVQMKYRNGYFRDGKSLKNSDLYKKILITDLTLLQSRELLDLCDDIQGNLSNVFQFVFLPEASINYNAKGHIELYSSVDFINLIKSNNRAEPKYKNSKIGEHIANDGKKRKGLKSRIKSLFGIRKTEDAGVDQNMESDTEELVKLSERITGLEKELKEVKKILKGYKRNKKKDKSLLILILVIIFFLYVYMSNY